MKISLVNHPFGGIPFKRLKGTINPWGHMTIFSFRFHNSVHSAAPPEELTEKALNLSSGTQNPHIGQSTMILMAWEFQVHVL